jgi:hypothetical protein
VVWGKARLGLAFYRAEGEVERAAEAVGGALRRWPLMAEVRGGGACRGGERVWEHGRVKGQPQGSLGRLYRTRKAREGDSHGYNVH